MMLYCRAFLLVRLGREEEAGRVIDGALPLARSARDAPAQAWTLGLAGSVAERAGRYDEAQALLAEAIAVCRGSALVETEALLTINVAGLAQGLGHSDEALRLLSEALARARSVGGRYRSVGAGYCLFNMGEILQGMGRYDEARRHLEWALVEFGGSGGHARGRALTLASLARLIHEQEDAALARAAYERALRALRESAPVFFEGQLRAAMGALLADSDEVAEAERAFDEAARQVTGWAEESVGLHRGHLDLAYARASEANGDDAGARRHRAEAQGRLDKPAGSHATEVGFARRMLERALAKVKPAQSANDSALVVSRDARKCRTPDGRVVDLSRRPRLRRLLLALVEARVQAPGQTTGVDALFERAWRGERATHESSRQRVYVAIAALRDLGLRELLQHDLDGYRIDPDVSVVMEAPPS